MAWEAQFLSGKQEEKVFQGCPDRPQYMVSAELLPNTDWIKVSKPRNGETAPNKVGHPTVF